MKLRPITRHQWERTNAATELLRRAVACLVVAGCPKAAAAVRKAQKSVDGAQRHASRRLAQRFDRITRAELARLVHCNSKHLPRVVNDGGRRKRWVGIGWVDEGPAKGNETQILEKGVKSK